jgi:tryptophanyl-tRNA synthetase
VYGNVFVVPEAYIPKETARIMSLSDPTRKMSKSDPEDSLISLLDDAAAVRRKIRRAVTDSEAEILFDPEKKPGVSNLLSICAAMTGTTPETVTASFQGMGYGELKEATAEAVIAGITPIQERYKELVSDKTYISGILKSNAERARALAQRTLGKAQKKLGLYQI